MSDYIKKDLLKLAVVEVLNEPPFSEKKFDRASALIEVIDKFPAADVEPVVRCVKCKYGTPLKRNAYDVHGLHCAIGRGEEVRNVWHKYSKHYEDYSLVDVDGFCDQGEAGEPSMERSGDA